MTDPELVLLDEIIELGIAVRQMDEEIQLINYLLGLPHSLSDEQIEDTGLKGRRYEPARKERS